MTAAVARSRPLVCMVSDRRRLAPAARPDDIEPLSAFILSAVQAGVDLVHIREPDLPARPLIALVQRAVAAAMSTHTKIIVNDRVDVAVVAGAHGIHLKGTSISAARVRSMAPPRWWVGQSVHGIHDVERLVGSRVIEHVDTLTVGAVFETDSKPGGQPVGLAVLEDVARRVSLPILAIGGITIERAALVARAGAAGVAVVGTLATAAGAKPGAFAQLVEGLRRSFDSAPPRRL